MYLFTFTTKLGRNTGARNKMTCNMGANSLVLEGCCEEWKRMMESASQR
jgi:hypothetical protein